MTSPGGDNGRAAWTREQVVSLLEGEDIVYHRIELPYGLSTEGHDRSATCAKIFPDDMTGKTVLDVGSKYGYFCFEALKRGARRAVGLDVDPEAVRKARLLADCLGLDAEFRVFDVEEQASAERFDYVLCLNVIHHLKNPLSVLQKLTAMARERLILEVAAVGHNERRKLGVSAIESFILNRLPVMYVGKNIVSPRYPAQTFFISRPAIENLLTRHTNLYARVETYDSDFKDRYLAVAHKRAIKNLLVVAGPTSVGKSTFIERLTGARGGELGRSLGLGDVSAWRVCGARSVGDLKEPNVEGLILHYDILRPYKQLLKGYAKDDALELVRAAERATLLTLWAEPAELRRRFEESEIARYGKKDKQTLRLREDYRSAAKIRAFYAKWFDFCRAFDAPHRVVSTEDARTFSVEEWEALEGAATSDA